MAAYIACTRQCKPGGGVSGRVRIPYCGAAGIAGRKSREVLEVGRAVQARCGALGEEVGRVVGALSGGVQEGVVSCV
ncbi:hypothetical protein N7491_001674 [Penicillium cf. griseofulvum]|uniref:Uncharacterized protein n=1 Tax=Penicillium cf. griseofulvum TaxID=2972120 RepID=A0A9W9JE52_9EURO|nr:hypothetical protein N7472_006803 [Penicillium cf. griseofulvum]KAJ5445592.1 hypothetical protein N7491_001674 [Penicillium cf. griseofulvum]